MTFEEWYAGYNPAHKSDKERAEDAWKAAAQTAAAAQENALDAEVKEMREALIDAAAHLIGAASAYEKYAKRFGGIKPKAVIDPFFETRHMDFHEAAGMAQAYLNKARWKHD